MSLPILLFTSRAFCQETAHIDTTISDTAKKAMMKSLLPSIGVGAGIISYLGDVNHNSLTNPLVSNYGYHLRASALLRPSIGLYFDFILGRITTNEKTTTHNRNFRTDIFSGSLNATYNFSNVLKISHVVNPYLSLGVGFIEFNTKGDLMDENGNVYNYWPDGSVRSIAEDDPLSDDAVILHRDLQYETDLREANLDGFGNYSEIALTVPVGLGINFRLSKRMNVKFGTTFSWTTTDLIDNISKNGENERKGNAMNDMFIFTSLSVHYDFFIKKPEREPSIYDEIDFSTYDKDDDDQDGVINFHDLCPETPEEVTIDETGCPLDQDGDGVPDYLDEEPGTEPGMAVNEKGVTITDEMIATGMVDTLAARRTIMFAMYPTMKKMYDEQADPRLIGETGNKRMDELLKLADIDQDGILTPDEVTLIIDHFFEGSKAFTVDEIYRLIEYLFEQ